MRRTLVQIFPRSPGIESDAKRHQPADYPIGRDAGLQIIPESAAQRRVLMTPRGEVFALQVRKLLAAISKSMPLRVIRY